MDQEIRHLVIVGGGSAGWLTAGIIAADHMSNAKDGLRVTLIESSDIPTIGVGEGTWPTMRDTLRRIGLSEVDFIRHCDASFKQGTRFINWVNGEKDDQFDHPFALPHGFSDTNLVEYWQDEFSESPFAETLCVQSHVCKLGLAPKQTSTPEYAAVVNYAYHLDAGKFATLLRDHCLQNLGVNHVVDDVVKVEAKENGDIRALALKSGTSLEGDIFIDCTGSYAYLMRKHFEIDFISRKNCLFNDSALAVQVPYVNDADPIASQTLSTAQSAGWIWDIGLPTRRGVGHVYSSQFQSDEGAEKELRSYLAKSLGAAGAADVALRKLSFEPGYLEKFWHRNCIAVGMSAGFIEPLEASALVMIELSATMISEQLPATRSMMDLVAERFNDRFRYRWERIIDFLKLHYVLSQRTESYWQENRKKETFSDRLMTLMELWAYQPPSAYDFTQVEEVFPAASYQYILYGMGYRTKASPTLRRLNDKALAERFHKEVTIMAKKFAGGLPSNRELIEYVKANGFSA